MGRAASMILGVALAACASAPVRRVAEERAEDASAPASTPSPDASVATAEIDAASPEASAPREKRAPFALDDVGPMGSARPDDGHWSPVPLENEGDEGPVLLRSVLHPDPKRPLSDLFVVAIDLGRVGLHAVAGTTEPKATTPEGKGAPRPATIPPSDRSALLAAFNGGWKSEHGHYGMKVDGVMLVPPKGSGGARGDEANCTVARYDDDTVHIGPWRTLSPDEPRMRFLRQTPPCLVIRGTPHPGLAVEMTTSWGATEQGDPLIRRSALGTNGARTILFFGLGNSLTARALADGMRHAGAVDIAELDVNWSYPKFLVFHDNAGTLEASSPFPNIVFDKPEYVRRRSERDFFYLVRR